MKNVQDIAFSIDNKNIDGNIRYKNVQHRWRDGKCIFCGTSQVGDLGAIPVVLS